MGFSFVHVSPVWGCKLLLHTLSSLMDGLLLLFQRVHALVWRRLYNIPGLPHLRLHSFVMLSHLAMENYTNSCDSELVAAKLLITNTFMPVLRDKVFKQRKPKTCYCMIYRYFSILYTGTLAKFYEQLTSLCVKTKPINRYFQYSTFD